MVKLTEREQELLDDLRAAAEGCDSSDGWKEVYLDNVPMRSEAPRTFAGLTGSLARKGLYREEDDAFGMVLMEAEPAWSARCDCYNGHASNSGRCTARGLNGITDPTRYKGQKAICESCRANCPCGEGDRKP